MIRHISIIPLIIIFLLMSSCDKVDSLLDPYEEPVIENIFESANDVSGGDTVRITVLATNPEEGLLYYEWSSSPSGGRFVLPADEDVVEWIAPLKADIYQINVKVSNDQKSSEAHVNIVVKSSEKPVLEIYAPENGSHHVQYSEIQIESMAYHGNGISRVELLVNGTLTDSSDYHSNDRYNFTLFAEEGLVGETTLTVKAYSSAAQVFSEKSVIVFIEGILPGRGEQ